VTTAASPFLPAYPVDDLQRLPLRHLRSLQRLIHSLHRRPVQSLGRSDLNLQLAPVRRHKGVKVLEDPWRGG